MPVTGKSVSKILILLRHGKAEASSSNGDYGRKLTDRGKRDVQHVIERAKPEIGTPDLIVTSGAARAVETAAIAAKALGYTAAIVTDDGIYDADASDLLEVVQSLPDTAETAMLVGHNPGFEEMGAMLVADEDAAVHMPTAGLVWIELSREAWSEVELREGRLLGVSGPKSE